MAVCVVAGNARAPGADNSRWGASSSQPPSMTQDHVMDGKPPSREDPPQSFGSKANAKYPKRAMEAVYFELQAKHALRLPAGVSNDDPSLFAVSGQPTVQEVLHSVNHGRVPDEEKPAMPDTPAAAADFKGPASNSHLSSTPALANISAAGSIHQQSTSGQTSRTAAAVPSEAYSGTNRQQQGQPQHASASPFAAAAADVNATDKSASHEHLQDTWVYRDPNWEVQGPFSKADILDWFEGGYFPADLPIKHASSPQADFKPLAAQIKIWAAAAPPGFARQEAQTSTAAAQPTTPVQQPQADQQPMSNAASGFQAQQQQPQTDISRTFTLTSADSGIMQHMGPSTASSARLDALETGSNRFSTAEPARPAPAPAGMDFINNLIRGSSGTSSVQHSLPTSVQAQDPLAHFPGSQQGASAAAAWVHQSQAGRNASGQPDTGLLGLGGSGLGQDAFGQRQYSQPAQQQPPQQHALPQFLANANPLQERSSAVHQDGGIFGQAFAPRSSANLDHVNLGSAGLQLQPQQQQQHWVSSCKPACTSRG